MTEFYSPIIHHYPPFFRTVHSLVVHGATNQSVPARDIEKEFSWRCVFKVALRLLSHMLHVWYIYIYLPTFG
jgi:hypothetical protein